MISIIVAKDVNDGIGNNGSLPWHSGEDLKRFKYLTLGKTLVMGRKTYESIGKPLPGRKTYVISKTMEQPDHPDVTVLSSPDLLYHGGREIMVCGGGEIYEYYLKHWIVNRFYLTTIDYNGPADTFFPHVNYEEHYNLLYKEKSKNLSDIFEIWERK